MGTPSTDQLVLRPDRAYRTLPTVEGIEISLLPPITQHIDMKQSITKKKLAISVIINIVFWRVDMGSTCIFVMAGLDVLVSSTVTLLLTCLHLYLNSLFGWFAILFL